MARHGGSECCPYWRVVLRKTFDTQKYWILISQLTGKSTPREGQRSESASSGWDRKVEMRINDKPIVKARYWNWNLAYPKDHFCQLRRKSHHFEFLDYVYDFSYYAFNGWSNSELDFLPIKASFSFYSANKRSAFLAMANKRYLLESSKSALICSLKLLVNYES